MVLAVGCVELPFIWSFASGTVVTWVFGILAAIAIPTFLGQRAGAQDRQAHTSLRNTMTLARAAAANTDSGNYPDATDLLEQLTDGEPAYTFMDEQGDPIVSTGPNEISVKLLNSEAVVLAARSESGTCWLVVANIGDSSSYGKFDTEEADCDASLVFDPDNGLDEGEIDVALISGSSFGEAVEMASGGGSPVPLTQADIILAFGDKLPGDWTNGPDWGVDDPCDNTAPYWDYQVSTWTDPDWVSLQCEGGEIVYLRIWDDDSGVNGISGNLDQVDELGQLTSLYGLYVSDKTATGPLPDWVGSLTHTRDLRGDNSTPS